MDWFRCHIFIKTMLQFLIKKSAYFMRNDLLLVVFCSKNCMGDFSVVSSLYKKQNNATTLYGTYLLLFKFDISPVRYTRS